MRKIGVIGGLSWVSTAEYYRLLNTLVQQRLGGASSARLAVESLDRGEYLGQVKAGDDRAAGEMVVSAARCLERAGVDFLLIACNDAHRFVPRIQAAVRAPLLHIADAAAEAVREAGLATVALLGTRETMAADFYPEALRRRGVATLLPEAAERTFVHDSIHAELVRDVFRDETRDRYLALIEALRSRGAEGVVLACTEIPLLVCEGDAPVPTFSTTALHCRAAVERATATAGAGGH